MREGDGEGWWKGDGSLLDGVVGLFLGREAGLVPHFGVKGTGRWVVGWHGAALDDGGAVVGTPHHLWLSTVDLGNSWWNTEFWKKKKTNRGNLLIFSGGGVGAVS